MKATRIIYNPSTGLFGDSKKKFDELSKIEQERIISEFREFINTNSKMTTYENDCMWMSYRYCIGRHTIAAHMHACDIWNNCKGRMSKEKELFTAFDINREIEQQLVFTKPNFYFPITSLNRIYTSALDIVFEFIEDYNINSKEDFLKYKDIHVILIDNERGYKIETITWEEWLRPKIFEFWKKYFYDQEFTEDDTWNDFLEWKKHDWEEFNLSRDEFYKEITKDIPNPEYFSKIDLEDLMVWNDLVHCFDYEHHHKSILVDGSECVWFWSWTKKTEKKEDGNYYFVPFGYEKIRVPLDRWNGSVTTYIPDSSIKKDIY